MHIADVSHYVREGKAIDREALKRGTSTYLVDRAVHMLPPLLSENLCSLKAGEDRLAVSVLIDLSATGEPQQYRFFPALVRVARRLTYPQVEAYLAGGVAPAGDQSFPGEILGQMDRLAVQLRQGVCSVGSSTSISLSRSLFLTTRGRFSRGAPPVGAFGISDRRVHDPGQ